MLKKLLIIIFTSCFIPFFTNAQEQKTERAKHFTTLAYNDVSIGRNISLSYHRYIADRWVLYSGLKYHINSPYYRNDYNLRTYLYKEIYAQNTLEHFGIKLGAEKIFKSENPNFYFFAYYDFQFTKGVADAKHLAWAFGNELYDISFEAMGNTNYITFENIVGLGMAVRLKEGVRFRIQGGIGGHIVRITDRGTPSTAQHLVPFYLSRQFVFGLDYDMFRNRNREQQEKQQYKEVENHNALTLAYDDIYTGRNLNIGYRYHLLNGVSIYGAFKYHINSRFFVDYTRTESYYYKQFRAQNMAEHLGLTVGIEKAVNLPGSYNLQPFFFYELQAMRNTVSNLASLINFSSGGSRGIKGSIYERKFDITSHYRNYGPVTALENYLGIGTRMSLTDKVSLKLKGGIGYNFYIGPDKYQDYTVFEGNDVFPSVYRTDVPWTAQKHGFSRMFSLGLEYRLGRR